MIHLVESLQLIHELHACATLIRSLRVYNARNRRWIVRTPRLCLQASVRGTGSEEDGEKITCRQALNEVEGG
uniref:Uncharacterized protein n=1 Tax=Physcomitrium patens TaxID=3218 RepID=A0A2K1K6A4_PHYPA|nr:hypothetical protein PHYPA_011202 [Physcomitrium patens]